MISNISIKPVENDRKVVIIDDADKMNINAQNALLKILEEPPSYAIIILIVANKEKILKTILSRVYEIFFEGLTNDELAMIVKDKNIDLDFARGSASKALLIENDETYKIAGELIEEINQKDYLKLNRKISEIKKNDVDIQKVLENLKILYYKHLEDDTEFKIKIIGKIDETIRDLKRNANIDLALDKLMIQICRA